jgi:DNA adenine methylase
MWRHNAGGNFNVGYGGEERRWVVSRMSLLRVSARLQSTDLKTEDFEYIINNCEEGDFLFLDPPYKPGERELKQAHYSYGKFSFSDQQRLANSLSGASKRGIKWAMTNSSHPEIAALYVNQSVFHLPRGTGATIGRITPLSGEVLITNY